MDGFMTAAQAVKALNVHRSRVTELIREGRLPAEKFGNQWMISMEAIAKFERLPTGWPKGKKRLNGRGRNWGTMVVGPDYPDELM